MEREMIGAIAGTVATLVATLYEFLKRGRRNEEKTGEKIDRLTNLLNDAKRDDFLTRS